MTERELTDEELLYASEEDWAFFNDAIKGLPDISNNEGGVKISKIGEPIPYGSGPHIVRWFKEAIELVKPKQILEIGFNVGYGAAMILKLSDACLVSCDITNRPETIDAYGHLMAIYKDRFAYRDRRLHVFKHEVLSRKFDLCFLDGDHSVSSIMDDISLCMQLGVPYILFDDWYERFGETKKAVSFFKELELVKDMNNLRLYKVNY